MLAFTCRIPFLWVHHFSVTSKVRVQPIVPELLSSTIFFISISHSSVYPMKLKTLQTLLLLHSLSYDASAFFQVPLDKGWFKLGHVASSSLAMTDKINLVTSFVISYNITVLGPWEETGIPSNKPGGCWENMQTFLYMMPLIYKCLMEYIQFLWLLNIEAAFL